MEGQELQEYGQNGLVNIEDYAMSADALVKQVGLIQDVMSRVMKDNEHYGTIPGTNKPTLLKPGAEKLCLLFRLNPSYDIIMVDREDFFISYTVKCTLSHIPTGQIIASGVGACNSKETKYRYRYLEESTGQPLPKAYWEARNSGDSKEMKRILGGDGFRAAKIDNVWVIAKSERIENDNPYDLDNTLMKMACKRALVAATLNATAASDIFTQDIEDMPPELVGGNGGGTAPATDKKTTVTRKSAGKEKGESKGSGESPQAALKAELIAYCGDDLDKQRETLKDISIFTNKDGEDVWIKGAHTIDKVSDKWAGTALGKLRELVKGNPSIEQTTNDENGPKECTRDPQSCPNSGWMEGVAYCGPDGPECKYNKES